MLFRSASRARRRWVISLSRCLSHSPAPLTCDTPLILSLPWTTGVLFTGTCICTRFARVEHVPLTRLPSSNVYISAPRSSIQPARTYSAYLQCMHLPSRVPAASRASGPVLASCSDVQAMCGPARCSAAHHTSPIHQWAATKPSQAKPGQTRPNQARKQGKQASIGIYRRVAGTCREPVGCR